MDYDISISIAYICVVVIRRLASVSCDQPHWIRATDRGAAHVRVGRVASAVQSDGIARDISAYGGVIIAVPALLQPRLGSLDLSGKAQVVDLWTRRRGIMRKLRARFLAPRIGRDAIPRISLTQICYNADSIFKALGDPEVHIRASTIRRDPQQFDRFRAVPRYPETKRVSKPNVELRCLISTTCKRFQYYKGLLVIPLLKCHDTTVNYPRVAMQSVQIVAGAHYERCKHKGDAPCLSSGLHLSRY